MAKINVNIIEKGEKVKRMSLKLYRLDGRPFVRYRKTFWPLINNSEIHITDQVRKHDMDVSSSDSSTICPAEPTNHSVAGAPDWDESQKKVIEATCEDRLLVGAGPGTGKTAVACARVSRLIDHDFISPNQIWLISFTRTAVKEIRDRISTYLNDKTEAYSIKIVTLDSYAWALHSGFNENARIMGSYEDNIETVLELIQQDHLVADELSQIEHLIIDEAQDIVGVRADLLLAIIRNLSDACGVTIFSDEAQAIYGFAEDREAKPGEPSLLEKIRNGSADKFRECELLQIHRTNCEKLRTIFSDTRRMVLNRSVDPEQKLANIRADLKEKAHGQFSTSDNDFRNQDDVFILYRRRFDVMMKSSMLNKDQIQHRIRMSGLPVCLAPWIGAVLAEHRDPYLREGEFISLWADRIIPTPLADYDRDTAWENLYRIAGESKRVVNMRTLRTRLGRKQPPADLCHSGIGRKGPIIGTIHASKGRETETVCLMVPATYGQGADHDEESRVLFVGATRGRSKLLIGKGFRPFASRLNKSSRTYRRQSGKNRDFSCQVEFGIDTDITAERLANPQFFSTKDLVRKSQLRILELVDRTVPLFAETDPNNGFAYGIYESQKPDSCISVFAPTVNQDLFTIAEEIGKATNSNRRPPDKINHLYLRGARTIVLPPDSEECKNLHEPWRTSGILLAPVIQGFSKIYFPKIKKSGRS